MEQNFTGKQRLRVLNSSFLWVPIFSMQTMVLQTEQQGSFPTSPQEKQRLLWRILVFQKSASKAWKYLPVNPGTDAALALAMIQWIIKNKRYNVAYLENANKAAAKASGEPTWTNAVWLVKIKDGKPDAFLRAQEIGLAPKEIRKTKDGKEYEFEYMVALKDGKPQKVDPNDEKGGSER